MNLQPNELQYLAAWAREEKAADPFTLPAHRLQAAHHIESVMLIRAIKAWARAEGKRDEDIFKISSTVNVPWPWLSAEQSRGRLEQIISELGKVRKAV